VTSSRDLVERRSQREPRTIPSTTALQEALGRFGRAVGAYGRAMAATCDEDDPASVARFLKAMAPIDVHRAGARGNGESDAPEVTDPNGPFVTPTPEGDPSPPTNG
jgi:hypothetical protein